ncbi:tRNA (adenosine(37)-N6)-threonylcarbamoyltransferase complex ATPase subunit type 1 TsaE [Desulfallas thermosapovorans]|uniref:tRNA threonylcarbamoyladenosine biosynthesis protein TsaE n=1 Tax=Desulfallas thermosapovorans DSM 6562 TaxID=1121431 RepID=A0A5S4ZTL1_9FIRM|nr:tRNA (adenosine(37)-N6)-threonylcarbamoyltransferase complex ATPase subunit type 1 TsaE [Desulfallas thermosapovorans]TYO96193.1 tRNA threonylcarbamoyladenosine biosynthesis protein TsaE [Desulfallas thermosapovorans DSM 6562]
MEVLETNSAGETVRLGTILGGLLQAGDVITLNGDLGAGKTCFTSGVARGLGINRRVTSPTFTLINEYNGRLPFYHLDVYRLTSPEELEDLGYEEYFYGSGVTIIEWAEQIERYLPSERLDIFIEKRPANEEGRILKLIPRGIRHNKLVEELMHYVRAGH